MVVLVGHALLLSGVGLDVNDVSDAVGDKVRRELDHTLLCDAYIIQPSTYGPNCVRAYP